MNKKKPLTLKKKYVKGFSLLELIIAVTIAAMMLTISTLGLRSLTNVNLKSELTKMVGAVSQAYTLASISGKTHRLVVDFDKNTFWVEEQSSQVTLGMPEFREDEFNASSEKKEDSTEEPIIKKASFTKVTGELGQENNLDSSIKFSQVWSAHLSEPVTSGKTALYFYPDGYAERAFICLSKREEEKSVMFLVVEPLTGKVTTFLGQPNLDEIKNSGVKELR